MDKLFYAVTAPAGSSLDEFSKVLRSMVGPAIAAELADGTLVKLRIRHEEMMERFRGTPALPTVQYRGEELVLDAVIDVVIPEHGAYLDGVHEALRASTSTFQGWRVEPTPYADSLPDPEIGVASSYIAGGAFIRRVDGMTRDRFSIEWHIHGVHEIARAKQQDRIIHRYIQNRVLEPITPTAWVIDGYEQAARPAEAALSRPVPSREFSFEDVAAGPGETQFFRMPTPVFYGTEYVVAC